jgi:hypothetical protein
MTEPLAILTRDESGALVASLPDPCDRCETDRETCAWYGCPHVADLDGLEAV